MQQAVSYRRELRQAGTARGGRHSLIVSSALARELEQDIRESRHKAHTEKAGPSESKVWHPALYESQNKVIQDACWISFRFQFFNDSKRRVSKIAKFSDKVQSISIRAPWHTNQLSFSLLSFSFRRKKQQSIRYYCYYYTEFVKSINITITIIMMIIIVITGTLGNWKWSCELQLCVRTT